MMTLGWTLKNVTKKFEDILKRERALQGFLNKNVAAKYQNLQRKRWITENSSEGGQWQRLNPKYAAYKRKRWMDAPGGGRKMLVASGTLFKCMITPGDGVNGYRKIATDRRLVISTGIEYARHVDEARTFSKWGRESIGEFRAMIYDFIVKNKLRPF